MFNGFLQKMEKKRFLFKMMPGFEVIPEEQLADFFPLADQRPQEAYLHPEENAIITNKHNLQNHPHPDIVELKEKAFDKTFNQSPNEAYHSEIIEIKGIDSLFLQFHMTQPESLYVAQMHAFSQKQLVSIGFSCPLPAKANWEKRVREMFERARIK